MKALEHIRYVLLDGGYIIYEAYTACIMFLSGILVLNPYTDVFSNGKAYALLSIVIDEKAFGALLLFSGLCSLFALYTLDLDFRKWAMLGQSFIWGTLFCLLVASSYSAWFPMLLAMNCLFCVAVFARINKEII